MASSKETVRGRWICLLVRHVGDRHRVHLVPVLVHYADEPSLPIAPRRRLAVPEFARQHHRLLTRRSVARQVHSFWIIEAFSAVGDVKMITRHEAFAPRRSAGLRYTVSPARPNRPPSVASAPAPHDNVRRPSTGSPGSNLNERMPISKT